MYCPKCNQEIDQEAKFCPFCGAQVGVPDKPMKWYKFVIYFQLFLAALSHIVSAIPYFTGFVQGDPETAKAVYTLFPSLKGVDISFGVISIGLAILALYTRSRLAHFRTNGPKMYFYYLIVTNLPAIAYPLLTSVVTGIAFSQLLDSTNLVSSLIACIILLYCNSIYFSKREHLFTNP